MINDIILPYAALFFITLVATIVFVSLRRSGQSQQISSEIEQNQRKLSEQFEAQAARAERQAAALERIATALEKRVG